MNPYFNLTSASNNKVWDYEWELQPKEQEKLLKNLHPRDFYKLIPLAFNEKQSNYNSDFQDALKSFISGALKDKNNHQYLTVRCCYSVEHGDKYPGNSPLYTSNRNNVLHALLLNDLSKSTDKDVALLKKIIKATIKAGVSPLEKSMGSDCTFLWFYLENHKLNPPNSLSFTQFLINLHPGSISALGQEDKPVFYKLCAEHSLQIYNLSAKQETLTLIAYQLPDEEVEINEVVLTNLYQDKGSHMGPETTVALSRILEVLQMRKEKLYLEQNVASQKKTTGLAIQKPVVYKI